MLSHYSSTEFFTALFNNYTANKWEHYLITFESNEKRMTAYQNGIQVGSWTTSSTVNVMYQQTLSFFVELGQSNIGFAAMGTIAGFRIYNRVLTAEEIATLATEYTPTV